jgi:hypothetical protein
LTIEGSSTWCLNNTNNGAAVRVVLLYTFRLEVISPSRGQQAAQKTTL